MVLDDFGPQTAAVDVGVDLGCGDALVAQHALNGSQIGAAFQQVSGKGVAEGVRADVLGDAGFFGQFFNQVEDHDTGEPFSSAMAHEHVVFVFFFYFNLVAVEEIELYLMDGTLGDGYQALFVAFAFHLDEPFVEVEVCVSQSLPL